MLHILALLASEKSHPYFGLLCNVGSKYICCQAENRRLENCIGKRSQSALFLFDLIWHLWKIWQNHMLEHQVSVSVIQRHGLCRFLGSKASMNTNSHVPKEPISFIAWPGFGNKVSFTAGLDHNKWKLLTSVVWKRRGPVNIIPPMLLLSS